MPAIDVIVDANVVLKWFHAVGEEAVEDARALVSAHQDRALALRVLDLTAYEIGNALLCGPARAKPEQVAVVLEALSDICPALTPTNDERSRAAQLGHEHDLTFHDAAYAAVAEGRSAVLATFDHVLLAADLGVPPAQLLDDRASRGD